MGLIVEEGEARRPHPSLTSVNLGEDSVAGRARALSLMV